MVLIANQKGQFSTIFILNYSIPPQKLFCFFYFRHSVPPHHTFYEEEGLNKRGQYEFTVAAVTKVGEGAKTQPVTLSPTSEGKFSTVKIQISQFSREINKMAAFPLWILPLSATWRPLPLFDRAICYHSVINDIFCCELYFLKFYR